MAQNMNQFLTLADRDISKVWFEEEPAVPTEYTQVFQMKSFDGKLYRREVKMGGFDGLAEIADGASVTYAEAIAPVARRYDFQTRGRAYVITRRLWENDEYGQVREMERALRRAQEDDVEQFAFNVLLNATGTTISTGFDGLALVSTAHTRLDGGATQSNRPSSLTALSLASLKDGVTAFRRFRDDRGRPYRSEPDRVLVPVSLSFTIDEILGSPDRPDTTNRAVNTVRSVGLRAIKSQYIDTGSTTYWSLFGPRHDVAVLWRNKPTTKSDTDFDSQNIHRQVYLDIGRGHGEWRDHYQGNS